jgi:hypothetical protein
MSSFIPTVEYEEGELIAFRTSGLRSARLLDGRRVPALAPLNPPVALYACWSGAGKLEKAVDVATTGTRTVLA